MRVLFVGDTYGRPGREAVSRFVPEIREREKIDFVILNAENAAGGRGLTPAVAEELFASGVDVLTMGNHTWDRPEVEDLLKRNNVLRPANYPPMLSGKGHGIYAWRGWNVGVLQVMGRLGISAIDCPFRTADAVLKEMKADVIIVDMHAEASSEKQAMGWHLDGRVAAVVGTHTHVQTADERILPGGAAYIGDAGMTGPRDGIIGGERDAALARFLTGLKKHIGVAEGDVQFCAVILDLDENTGKARGIRRVQEIMKREAVSK